MFPTVDSADNIKPFRFKSFNGEPDAQDLREQAQREAAEAVLAPPPPPVYSQADVDAARAQGFAAGKSEGYRDGLATLNADEADRQSATAAAATKLIAQIIELSEKHTNFIENQREILTNISLKVAKKVAGQALRDDPLIEIESMVHAALSMLAGDLVLKVFVHPAIVSYMESIYAEKAVHEPEAASRATFAADPSLTQLDDCRVQWINGMMERKQEMIWANVEKTLAAFDPLSTHR